MWAGLASFLISIAGSLAARVMLALGIGTVSYLALNTVVQSLISNVTTAYSGVGGSTLQILNLCGFGAAISILASGLVTKAGLMAVKKLTAL